MKAGSLTEFLGASPVFATLPAKEIAGLAAVAHERSCRTREFVFMEGDASLWFYLVRSGRIKIVRQSRAGKDVVLELLGPGQPFGGVAVIEQRPYPASAQATEPSIVVQIPRDAVVAVAERHPSLIREMALMIGRRLREAHDAMQSLAVDPVPARLAAALLKLVERDGTRGQAGLVLPFHLTRQNLADMTGTTVETAIRVVSRWIDDELVRDDGGHLVVCDLPALRQLAEGEDGERCRR
jgi:CRP/FNR family transcriptional regulator